MDLEKMSLDEANNIPGMIEESEKKLLYVIAQTLPLEDGDSIIEFGPFFGQSTNCIAQGLKANSTFGDKCNFYTYDSFECNKNGWFGPQVLLHAKKAEVSELVKTEGEIVNFEKVFYHFMKDYIEAGIVKSIKSELLNSEPPAGKIPLLQIDSPKYYEELKIILEKFLPLTKVNGFIVFQDFFYQWSATIILPVAILIDRGFISIQGSAASSLLCQIIKVPNEQDIKELDEQMKDEEDCFRFFELVINRCKIETLDKPEFFLPKITLAQIQWLYQRKKYKDARYTIIKYLKDGNPFHLRLVDTFLELLGFGFSIRRLFEMDQSIEKQETLSGAGKFKKEESKI
ncbi:MAG: hypothetical protein CMP38_03890 [Rickettsiales bacterium]|nr:hypothetical protein [Rickettsiales bacterium]OUW02919.1 MAG: hypothetical protein CBD16_03785 [Betaproteobacteria bacterium TMED156]|tara:strand:+ start:112 stop:1140 length:1029 start_codon:yes stop_codon:yes gene_type:complete